MPLLFFFLSFFIFPSSQAEETIRFQAANTSILRDAKHGLHFANFVKHKSKYLNATPFKSLLVPNEKKCQVSCIKDFRCLSFNVAAFPNSDGQYKCELLDKDRFNSSARNNMTDNVNYHHFNIKTPCEDEVCKSGGSCHPHYSTNSYSCKCQCPYYGERCQKIIITTPWSAWSECSFNGTCERLTLIRNRTRSHSHPELVASVCPERNNAIQEVQICTLNEMYAQVCENPLGVQDGSITNSQLTASSLTYHWWPHHARLNQYIGHYGSWMPDMTKEPPHYLAIDLGTVMHVTKIATQGSPHSGSPYYITRYNLKYSTDNKMWKDYHSSQCIKTLPGNTNSDDVVTNTLEVPIKARYVRIMVKEYNDKPALRAELYGCPV